MANNIVSKLLVSQSQKGFVMNCVERERLLKDYADKLDRLVKEARELIDHPIMVSSNEDGDTTLTFCKFDVDELAAALDAIKLPEDNQNDKRN